MSKVIAIFGAGTGLGASVARRFGREGFQVALIARRPDRLDELVMTLSGEGINAAAFPADLADPPDPSALAQRDDVMIALWQQSAQMLGLPTDL